MARIFPAMRLHTAVLALTLAAFPVARAQAPADAPWPAATLPNTETHVLTSAVNGREYHIAVALPMGYHAAASDTMRYPVLYVLDGGAHLPMFASMFRFTNRANRTGDVIMVGIGYYAPGTFTPPPPGQTSGRNIDYVPAPYRAGAAPTQGNAAAFHRILRDEIIPLIERRYRTAGPRTLHGHSYGGLLATYVLFEEPDLFDRYAIMSPAYSHDGRSMFEREARFRTGRRGLAKEVFLAAGSLEGPAMVGDLWRMTAAFCEGVRQGNYAGLRVHTEVVADEQHNSSVLLGRALTVLFPPPGQPAARDACTGR
jgi:predicted alpha/beta superfamily hydrolase